MIFLTVGTQFPFDRLVRAVDEALDQGLIDEEVFAQIGETSYRPRNFKWVMSFEKKVFDERLKESSGVISHAGIGTITMAFENHKPLIVMPRLKQYGEVVNNHQLAIAKKFEQLGHLLAAYSVEELPGKIEQLHSFKPIPREGQACLVANRIARFLDEIRVMKGRTDKSAYSQNFRI